MPARLVSRCRDGRVQEQRPSRSRCCRHSWRCARPHWGAPCWASLPMGHKPAACCIPPGPLPLQPPTPCPASPTPRGVPLHPVRRRVRAGGRALHQRLPPEHLCARPDRPGGGEGRAHRYAAARWRSAPCMAAAPAPGLTGPALPGPAGSCVVPRPSRAARPLPHARLTPALPARGPSPPRQAATTSRAGRPR